MSLNELLISSNQHIGLIPSQWVSFHEIEVPVKSKSQAYTVVPFALEDQLVQDIDQLHFSLLKDREKWLVWVCDKARLISMVEDETLRPKYVVPDYFALPYDGQPCYLIDDERVLVRLDAYRGFSIPQEHFEFSLERLSLAKSELVLIEQPLLTLLDSMSPPKISLLQGELGHNISWHQWLYPWMGVAASLMVFLTLFLFQGHNENKLMTQKINEQTKANVALFRQLFPEETRIVNIRSQAQQKLNRLAKIKEQKKTNMIALLDQILPLLKTHTVISIKQIQYNNYVLELELEAGSLAQVEQFNNQLKNLDKLSVEVKKLASTDTGQAVTSLVVKRVL